MHLELSAAARNIVEASAVSLINELTTHGDSLALAREAWINAFDKAAAELEA